LPSRLFVLCCLHIVFRSGSAFCLLNSNNKKSTATSAMLKLTWSSLRSARRFSFESFPSRMVTMATTVTNGGGYRSYCKVVAEQIVNLKRLLGTPELMDHLESLAQSNPGIENFLPLYEALYDFSIDNFQLESLSELLSNHNVLVCSPTGSGKTLIGELAIYCSIMKQQQLIYTTPLKALSNQKFHEFSRRFGSDRVGLCTGDVVVNSQAPIVVMTTEVFRNQLYSSGDRYSTGFENVFTVVLDEFHFMNDPERGTVWEESIISCPSTLNVLALSATIGNAPELCAWMTASHKFTSLVTSVTRPVPLHYWCASSAKQEMKSFFVDKNMGPGSISDTANKDNKKKWKLNSQIACDDELHAPAGHNLKHRRSPQRSFPRYADVVLDLHRHDRLNAIFFMFSRQRCESAAIQLCSSRLKLISLEDINRINHAITCFIQRHPTIPISPQSIRMLHAGIAVHHAGLLSQWRQLIEELFAANLVKVLFATETLAAGK
jgi:superfamily II RNA helicase